MRMFLRILAWLFTLAAIIRAGLAVFTAWLAATDETVAWDISAEQLAVDHLPILVWAFDFGKSILPDHFVNGIILQPALVVLPLGALAAAAIAFVLFKMSR